MFSNFSFFLGGGKGGGGGFSILRWTFTIMEGNHNAAT